MHLRQPDGKLLSLKQRCHNVEGNIFAGAILYLGMGWITMEEFECIIAQYNRLVVSNPDLSQILRPVTLEDILSPRR